MLLVKTVIKTWRSFGCLPRSVAAFTRHCLHQSVLSNTPRDSYLCGDTNAAINDMLGKLSSVSQLELRFTSAVDNYELPDKIVEMTQLTSLVLGRCVSQQLPEGLGNLVNLRSFEVYDLAPTVSAQALPSTVAKWGQIRRLVLRGARISFMPQEIGELGGTLRELDLSFNPDLADIPHSLAALTGLTSLRLRDMGPIVGAKFEGAVGSIGWIVNHFVHLRALDVCRCGIEEVRTRRVSLGTLASLRISCPTTLKSMPLRRRYPGLCKSLIALSKLPHSPFTSSHGGVCQLFPSRCRLVSPTSTA